MAGKLTLKAGSSREICGERGASTHPFDPGTVFSLEVHYYTNSNSSSSSSSNSNSSSSNHKDVAYVGALLRPFDPGKRCRRGARIEKAVRGLVFLLTAGKHGGGCSMEGDGLHAEGIASCSTDVTWGYRRRSFVGELPRWGGGAVMDCLWNLR